MLIKKSIQSKNVRIQILKMIPIVLVTGLSLLIGILISCSDNEATIYRIISFKGEGSYYNFSKANFGYVVTNDSLSSTALLAGDGDLILIDDEIIFNNTSSEKELNLSCSNGVLYNFGKPIIITFSVKDSLLLTWLDNLDPADLNDLKSITVPANITLDYVPFIAKIAKSQPRIGICIEEKNGRSDSILALFDPTWIIFENLNSNQFKLPGNLKNLEMLGLSFNDSLISQPLPVLPALKHLLLINLQKNTVIDAEFLKNNRQIETIVCSGTDITDFSFIQSLKKIKSLSITSNEALTDLEFVKRFSHLESISITIDYVDNIELINNLRNLKWITFSGNLTQQKFNSFIETHPNLEVVELIESDSIIDLRPLSQLKKLSALVLSDTLFDTHTPPLLKNLRYLSLPASTLSDSVYASNLQQELPECTIVPNEGFCMGSGWLLFFLPVLLLLILIKCRFRERIFNG